MRQQIANLLAAGSTKEQVLAATGCSEALFAELLADKEFVEEIKSVAAATRENQIEEEYSKLEMQTLKKVKGNLEYYDAIALCKILETVSKTRQMRRMPAAAHQNNGHFTNPTLGVTVQIPVFLGNSQVVLDSNKQVVAIGGRNMAPLPTDQVHRLFSELEQTRSNQNEQQQSDPILADLAELENAERTSESTGNRAQLAA